MRQIECNTKGGNPRPGGLWPSSPTLLLQAPDGQAQPPLEKSGEGERWCHGLILSKCTLERREMEREGARKGRMDGPQRRGISFLCSKRSKKADSLIK